MLSSGVKVDLLDTTLLKQSGSHGKNHQVYQCSEVKKIMDSCRPGVMVLILYLWLDDFDPNNSSKSNRNSVWIMTGTLGHDHTFVISMGRKGSSHKKVEEELLRDLQSLGTAEGNKFYYKNENRYVNVSVKLLIRLADSPERHDILCIKRGNSLYTSRFGFCLTLCQ